MGTIIEQVLSSDKPENVPLSLMINLIELEHPDKDLDDPTVLCGLLNKEFDSIFTESDIYNFYSLSIEEEDLRLQYKHLNISLV
jgi:hypothetical protein